MGRRSPESVRGSQRVLDNTTVMTPPIPKETLLLYISAITNVVSTVLVANDKKKKGRPILFNDLYIT
jgi:hypothetical protein